MDTVECPGCLQQFDPVLMNDRMLGINLRSDGEETTTYLSYCPGCGKRIREMDQEEILNDLEALMRHRMVMEDLAKLGKVK
jgi:uncharacterized protein with PIN domain